VAYRSGTSRELSSHSVTGASKSFGAGSSSVKEDLELSVPACSASKVRLSRGLSECPWLSEYNDHSGTLTQGFFFLLVVAAVDDVMRSPAVCTSDFSREGGVRGTELASDLDKFY
jgi:hypothetical protein